MALFSCKQSKLLQSTSRIFNTLSCDTIKLQAILMIRLEVAEVILRRRVGGGGGEEGGGGLNSGSKFFIRASTQVKGG